MYNQRGGDKEPETATDDGPFTTEVAASYIQAKKCAA
jgi:hypothetical protein